MISPSIPSFFQDFGGIKVNASPISDPTTDYDASNFNSAFASLSGIANVSPIAIYKIDTNSGNPSITDKYLSFQSNGNESITSTSTGIVVLKLYTDVYDLLNNQQTLNPRFITAQQDMFKSIDSLPVIVAGMITATSSDLVGNYIEITITTYKPITAVYDFTKSLIVSIY